MQALCLGLFLSLLSLAAAAGIETQAHSTSPGAWTQQVISDLNQLGLQSKLSKLGLQWWLLKRTPEIAQNAISQSLQDHPNLAKTELLHLLENEIFPSLIAQNQTPIFLAQQTYFYKLVADEANSDFLREPSQWNPNEGERLWELIQLFWTIKPCYTACLENRDAKVIRGFIRALEHPQLAKAMVELNNPFYGCGVTTDGKSIGTHFKDYDRQSLDQSLPLGTPIYLMSLNDHHLHNPYYRGENGIIRSISNAAKKDLQILGGTGGDYTHLVMLEELTNFARFKGAFLHGVSEVMVSYWQLRNKLAQDLSEGEAKAQARAQYLNRPFFLETYFEPTHLLSGPTNLADWMEFLYQTNPSTPYQLITYNFFTESYFAQILAQEKNLPSFSQVAQDFQYAKAAPEYVKTSKPDRVDHNLVTSTEFWHRVRAVFE